MPDSGIFKGEFASEIIARLPLTAPAPVGVNFTVNVTLWLGLRVAGSDRPVTENPEPVMVACEIVTDELPVFVRVSGLLLLFPNWTLPKAMLVGFADKTPELIPVPLSGRTVVSSCCAWALANFLR